MDNFYIKPDLISITKSKKKFLYIGIVILIINFCCVGRYVQLALDGQSAGYILLIFTLVNFPLFIVAGILLFVPRLHGRYYSKLVYQFDDQCLIIGTSSIEATDIEVMEIEEFYSGFYKVNIFTKFDKQIQLCGISSNDLNQVKKWANLCNLNVI